MKYSDYNVVEIDFYINGDVFYSKYFTQVEFNAILKRVRKSNIVIATVHLPSSTQIVSMFIQGYNNKGVPSYKGTIDETAYVLLTTTDAGKTAFVYRPQI